jgi:tetratricopeptide (TPR) repeat protein
VGDVVNTAARLMEASQNDVLCNAETYQSAQTRLPFQTLPQFALKGKAEPVAVYRALGDARDAGRLPAMVGRTTERATLAAHLQALGDGRSGTLLIEGWAGIGKSRLVADLLQQASASGVASWVGAGDALEKSTPYHAWRSIFLQLFGLDELAGLEARRALVLDRLAPEPALSRLTPLLNAVVSLDLPENEFTKELTGEVRADNRHDLLVRLLQMAATTTPLLLILEDGQWLDSASWALMRLVHKHVQPVLLVVAARPMDSLLPEPYLLVRDAPGTQRLHLDALSLEDTRELLSERLGVPGLSEALVTLIHDWAEGSPLFTEELAYFLRDRGLIHVSNGVCQVAPNGGELTLSTLPKSVEVVIASRVAQLTAEQQFTLKVASAIGRAFPYRLLQDIYPIGVDRDQLRKDLDALERLDVIALLPSAMEETYTFKQIITHQVVYGRLPFALRRQLHQAIAEWYERTYAGDLSPFGPLLAHHWYRVTGLSPEPDLALPAGDLLTRPLVPEVTVRAPTTVEVDAHAVARTIEYSEEAGEQALRNFANEEAVAFLSGALELDAEREHRSGPLRRARWELQLGEAYVNWSKYAEGRQHLEAGLGLLGQPVPAALPGQVVSLVGQVLRQLLFRSSSARRVVHSAEGRSALLAASRAYERLTEVYYFANETVLSLVAALRTLNLAEAAGPSPELARGYAAVGALLGLIPLRGMADAYSCRALEAVEDVDHQPARAFVSLAVGFYYAGVGDWDRAQQRFEEVVEISERLGNRRRRDDGLSGSLYVNYFRGAFSSCGQVADDLIRSAIRRDDPRSWASGLQAKACCLLRTGRFDEAIRCLQQSQSLLATGAGTVDEAMEIELYGLFSSALLHRSEHGQALAVAGKLADLTTEAYPSNFGTLVGYAAPAEVYLALWEANHPQPDLGDLARKACKTLRGFARVFSIGQPRASLWQGLYEWLAGKPAKASKAWHESLDAAERLSMPYDQGLAHYEIGRHLAQNDPARRKHLTRAGELFADLGASHNLRLAEEELAQSQSA